MSEDPGAALASIEAFVGLARQARRRALPRADRERLMALDEQLRDLIDGARPAPGRIDVQPEAPAPPPPPEPLPAAATSTPQTAHEIFQELRLRPEEAKKLNRVGLQEVKSAYTPSRRPAFLDAYFDDAVAEVEPPTDVTPRQVVDAEGAPVELPVTTRDLWGVGGAEAAGPAPDRDPRPRPRGISTPPDDASSSPKRDCPSPPSRRASASPRPKRGELVSVTPAPSAGSAAPAEAAGRHANPVPTPSEARPPDPGSGSAPASPAGGPSPTTLPPAIVHLLEGGTRRGFIDRFDAAEGRLLMVGERGLEEPEVVRLDEVLVIFFGRRPSDGASRKSGMRVEVTLVNDRRITGFSEDYQPDGSALTVVPEKDRRGVDRVWVPAWSVKNIGVS